MKPHAAGIAVILAMIAFSNRSFAKDKLADVPSKHQEQARAAFSAAALMILGRNDNVDFSIQRFMDQDAEKKVQNGSANMGDALQFYKAAIFKKGGGGSVVMNGYRDVFGRDARPAELRQWQARIEKKEVWYATLIPDLDEQLKKDPFERRCMIERVYLECFGRAPTEGDLKYWMPKSERFSDLLPHCRSYLYSSKGVNDLYTAVDFAMSSEWSEFSAEDVAKCTAHFKKAKATYVEMVEMCQRWTKEARLKARQEGALPK